MGAKTVRRLVILIVTVLVVGVSIFFAQRYQVSRMNQSVLARAAKAEAEAEAEREKPAISRRRSGFIKNILRWRYGFIRVT